MHAAHFRSLALALGVAGFLLSACQREPAREAASPSPATTSVVEQGATEHAPAKKSLPEIGEEQEGSEGADTLEGSGGNDGMFGEEGDDQLVGGPGSDQLTGGEGSDLLIGGEGDDFLIGGPGDDEIEGGPGADRIRAGEGADTVRGGAGNDDIQGGEGDDHLQGDEGDDKLMGQDGIDVLRGGPGTDTITGQEEGDFFVYAPADIDDNTDQLVDFTPEEGDVLDVSEILAAAGYAGDGSAASLKTFLRVKEMTLQADPTGKGAGFKNLCNLGKEYTLEALLAAGALKLKQ